MKLLWSSLAGLIAYGAISLAYAAEPAQPGAPAVSNEANTALQLMGKTLSAENISVKARTLRVYQDDSGDYLHIAHTINIMARRPDRMLVTATGDDGLTKMVYDSKQVSVLDANQNKYAQVAMTGDLDHVIDEVSDRMGIDFPLADFLRSDPAKSVLDRCDQWERSRYGQYRWCSLPPLVLYAVRLDRTGTMVGKERPRGAASLGRDLSCDAGPAELCR